MPATTANAITEQDINKERLAAMGNDIIINLTYSQYESLLSYFDGDQGLYNEDYCMSKRDSETMEVWLN